jgi:MSHA pilin protein MshA
MAITHAKALVNGTEASATSTLTLEGTSISMVYGYPAVGSIDEAAGLSSTDYTIAGDGTVVLKSGCTVTYTAATDANTPATVTVDTSDC